MVNIASRKSWGARYSDGDLTLSGLATHVVLHHSVTAQLSPDASVEEEREQMRAIESVGQSRFGTGISYNVVVFPSGRAYQGVSFNRRGTHTGGHNSTRRSITFAGNYETNKPTDAQVETARALVAEGRGRWWRKAAPVQVHGDYTSTACPGRHVEAKRAYIASGKAPAKPANPLPAPPPVVPRPGKLVVDGKLGPATVKALQRELGTTVDGVLSSQPSAYRDHLPTVTGGAVQFWNRPKGSRAVVALQRKIGGGVSPDGLLGPHTLGMWQRKLGVHDDTYFGPESVKALQTALNAGKLW